MSHVDAGFLFGLLTVLVSDTMRDATVRMTVELGLLALAICGIAWAREKWCFNGSVTRYGHRWCRDKHFIPYTPVADVRERPEDPQ